MRLPGLVQAVQNVQVVQIVRIRIHRRDAEFEEGLLNKLYSPNLSASAVKFRNLRVLRDLRGEDPKS